MPWGVGQAESRLCVGGRGAVREAWEKRVGGSRGGEQGCCVGGRRKGWGNIKASQNKTQETGSKRRGPREEPMKPCGYKKPAGL